jgi:hypothetical protein
LHSLYIYISLLTYNVSAEPCPQFRYALSASTTTATLTNFESDLVVPAAPINTGHGITVPAWGIFPFIEPDINKNDARYGIVQPVLEWNYNHQTNQWTITPWYEDLDRGKLSCGTTLGYCSCTPAQKLLGLKANTSLYTNDVPQCHNRCDPKHGPRITASPGDTLHFTITKTENGWTTTALNTNTNRQTSFQTTCIKPNDRLKVGFALENGFGQVRIDNSNNNIYKICPGNIKFTNIKFTGNTGTIQLKPTIEPTAKKCFPWLDIQIDNSGVFGWFTGNTNAITFITQPPNKNPDL